MNQNPDIWKSDNYRQNVRTRLDEVFKQLNAPTAYSGLEIEQKIYDKTLQTGATKEIYHGLLKKITMQIQQSFQNKQRQAQQQMQQQHHMQQQQLQPQMQQQQQPADPMSALQNLASSQAPSDLGTMHNQMSMSVAPGQGMHESGPPMMPGPQGQMSGPGQQQMQANMQPGMNQMVGQPRMAAPMQRMMMNPQGQIQGGQMMQQMPGPGMRTVGPQNAQMQQQQMARARGPGPGMNFMNRGKPGGDSSFGYMQQQQGPPGSGDGPGHFNAQPQMGGPPPQQQQQQQPPGPNHPNFMMHAQPGQQQQHGPGPMHQNMPSPYSGHPSPGGQGMMPSPMSGQRPPMSVGPPSVTLNTPQMINVNMSPASRQQQEMADQELYLNKLKQLSKYIEPLRKTIARLDREDGQEKKNISKIKGLLDIVSDPNRRVPMETLLKCEKVLEGMVWNAPKAAEQIPSVPQSQLLVSGPLKQDHNICQPLLDAVLANIKKPTFNHTLHRTFGPAVAALTNTVPRPVSPPAKRQKVYEEPSENIPELLQGEIARLDTKFKVQLDPLQHHGSSSIQIVCRLDDRDLPSVPPISVKVPELYPNRPPQVVVDSVEYSASKFLQESQRILEENMRKLPRLHSLTALLCTWEMSVRQACQQDAEAAVG